MKKIRVIKIWDDWLADYIYYLQAFRGIGFFRKKEKWVTICPYTYELSKAQKWAEYYKTDIIEIKEK